MASAGIPSDVPPIGLLHATRALHIYRRHKINALMWTALSVCLRSLALIATISVALLIVCAWSLTRHVQYIKPPYGLPVFSRLLARSGMAFTAINAALLTVELATGARRGTWFDAGGWLAPAWPQILPDIAGTTELVLVGTRWIVMLDVVVAVATQA